MNQLVEKWGNEWENKHPKSNLLQNFTTKISKLKLELWLKQTGLKFPSSLFSLLISCVF